MTLQELIKKCEFHDSLLNRIEFNKNQEKLLMDMELCDYEQKTYKNSSKESINIQLVFSGCKTYKGLSGKLDTHSILETKLDNSNQITFNIMDDMSNKFYQVTIKAESVEVIKQ